MPIYDYHCESCGKTKERIFPMHRTPRSISCECGKRARKVCAACGWQDDQGRAGGLMDDHPVWMRSTIIHLQPEGERPIASRSEMMAYMKRKRIKFADEVGPVRKPIDTPRYSPEFRDRAIRLIGEAGREARRLSVNINMETTG